MMKIFTEEELREELTGIIGQGWIRSRRPGNDGSVGNTIEDLLEIPENNLQVADAGQFEIKGKKTQSGALLTLYHLDPLPRIKFPGRSRISSPIQPILVDKFGWPHRTREGENSFRLTINTRRESGRGFRLVMNRDQETLTLAFNPELVDAQYSEWLDTVYRRTQPQLSESFNEVVSVDSSLLNPEPYWRLSDIIEGASKLEHTILVLASSRSKEGYREFNYKEAYVFRSLQNSRFLDALENGIMEVDFDARTGHNHGTKFRIRKNLLSTIFDSVETFIEGNEQTILE